MVDEIGDHGEQIYLKGISEVEDMKSSRVVVAEGVVDDEGCCRGRVTEQT